MLSAIGLSDSAHSEYSALAKGTLRALSFKMDTSGKSKMEIDVDKTLSKDDSSFDDIAQLLPSDQCRYLYFNLDYMEGLGHRTKTFFVLWAPSDAKGKDKMVYASCAVPLKAKLGGGRSLTLQTGSVDAFDYSTLVDRCRAMFD